MAIVLPLASTENGKLISSAVLVGQKDNFPIFVSTLHQIGQLKDFKIGVPPHQGVISSIQEYPQNKINAIDVELVKADPIYDLAFFKANQKNIGGNIPNINIDYNEISIGEELIVLGYPYSTLGSFLETASITHVSAKGRRMFMNKIQIDEFIISHQTLQGSSGSAVVKRSDGSLCGIVRGTLAPPNIVSIADVPLASDTNVTYVTFSSIISETLKNL